MQICHNILVCCVICISIYLCLNILNRYVYNFVSIIKNVLKRCGIRRLLRKGCVRYKKRLLRVLTQYEQLVLWVGRIKIKCNNIISYGCKPQWPWVDTMLSILADCIALCIFLVWLMLFWQKYSGIYQTVSQFVLEIMNEFTKFSNQLNFSNIGAYSLKVVEWVMWPVDKAHVLFYRGMVAYDWAVIMFVEALSYATLFLLIYMLVLMTYYKYVTHYAFLLNDCVQKKKKLKLRLASQMRWHWERYKAMWNLAEWWRYHCDQRKKRYPWSLPFRRAEPPRMSINWPKEGPIADCLIIIIGCHIGLLITGYDFYWSLYISYFWSIIDGTKEAIDPVWGYMNQERRARCLHFLGRLLTEPVIAVIKLLIIIGFHFVEGAFVQSCTASFLFLFGYVFNMACILVYLYFVMRACIFFIRVISYLCLGMLVYLFIYMLLWLYYIVLMYFFICVSIQVCVYIYICLYRYFKVKDWLMNKYHNSLLYQWIIVYKKKYDAVIKGVEDEFGVIWARLISIIDPTRPNMTFRDVIIFFILVLVMGLFRLITAWVFCIILIKSGFYIGG